MVNAPCEKKGKQEARTATDRQRISSEMAQIIFREFTQNERVEFCYPHTEILHRPRGQPGMPPTLPGN